MFAFINFVTWKLEEFDQSNGALDIFCQLESHEIPLFTTDFTSIAFYQMYFYLFCVIQCFKRKLLPSLILLLVVSYCTVRFI